MRRPFRLSVVLLVFESLLLLPALQAAGPAMPVSESERLHRLFDRAWEDKLRLTPEFATYIGFPGHNDRWSDYSPAGIERRHALASEQLKELQAIDRGRLTPVEQVYLDLFRRRLEGQIEGFRFPVEQTVLTQADGVQLDVPRTFALAPAATLHDYEDLLARLRSLPELVDQDLALLETGLAAGVTPPKILMRGVPDQVRALVPGDPWRSPLLARFRQFPASVPPEDQTRLRQAALDAYEKKAAPAFRKLLSYLTETYIPGTRESLGLGALPGGAEWYAWDVRKATTTDLTPRQIHETGLAEVKRIRAEMDQIIANTGFHGSFADFVRFLHTDPRFFYDKPEDLVAGYRAIAGRADLKVSSLFGTRPGLSYQVAPIPAETARLKATAYYEPGSVAAGRPGTCFVNTFDLKARPKWEMEALALHECTPGHHLQVSLAQEIKGVPRVLNYHDYTAFVEGWGLYAETLGDEMGFYRDPYFKFGQLSYEMWRTLRLVVDTGIHSQGWTKPQAIEYFRENTAQDERAIEAEINRYIADPGLALAYKIGELKIRELRASTRKELGPAFDLRAFHDEVLRHGAVPLDLLEQNVKAWVAAVKAAPSPAITEPVVPLQEYPKVSLPETGSQRAAGPARREEIMSEPTTAGASGQQTIPEQQYVTGTVGTPMSVILAGEPDVPPPGPGMTVMEAYDPAYLEVLQCGWYPVGELVGTTSFQVIFMPKKAGSTEVKFTTQPRAINPLFMPVTFFVTINA